GVISRAFLHDAFLQAASINCLSLRQRPGIGAHLHAYALFAGVDENTKIYIFKIRTLQVGIV
ncbi:hypothetical protein PO124_32015, partial [Bacillus licheniformis]|nr:hypothetical protein [Bacillus licheniformis]